MSVVKKFSVPRGTCDTLPSEIHQWHHIENTARRLFSVYGYREVRTPYFEETGLFARSLGQTSDVVQKQMLNLFFSAKEEGENRPQNKSRDDQPTAGLSLRPEATASIVRSYIENSFHKKESLSKFYYIGPMFRGERPQKGRLRQFHQIGVEAIGPDSSSPYLDAEVIALSVQLLNDFGLTGFQLKINSLGSPEDKKKLSDVLRAALQKDLAKLCPDCQNRFERNVFRILDCKNLECKTIVSQLKRTESHLSKSSQAYFSEVKDALTILNVPFEVSPYLVRGLDYYTHTVFEISHSSLGSQDALGAGGRYNSLLTDLGADAEDSIGAIGFALGIERILLVRNSQIQDTTPSHMDVFIVTLDPQGRQDAFTTGFKILREVRSKGISAEMNYARASLKSQMRLADKLGARYVVIIGENELKEQMAVLKDMEQSLQDKIQFNKISTSLKEKLKG